jgi:hypothetical protein
MIHSALLIILYLDMAQEICILSNDEIDLRKCLNRKVLALSVVERSRKRQCARIANFKEGDANTKFFHMRVNARRRKNHIFRLKHNNGWVTDHKANEKIIQNHFQETMGMVQPRSLDFNWESLLFTTSDLDCLGAPFSEEEVKEAINQMPNDKAPGPNGFPVHSSSLVGTLSGLMS